MEQFVAYLVKNLVDQPEAVEVRMTESGEDLTVAVKVSKEDVAKVVGREGRIIRALGTIAFVVGARAGRRVRMELAE